MRIFVFILLLFTQNLIFGQERKIPPDSLRMDLDTLFHIMQNAHPAPFAYTTSNPSEKYLELKSKLSDSLTQREFYQLLSPFYALMHDAHCSIFIPTPLDDYRKNDGFYIPVAVKSFGGQLFIINDRDSVFVKGSKLISINGIPSDSISSTLLSVFPSDGNIKTTKERWMDSRFEPSLSAFYTIGEDNEIVVENYETKKIDTIPYKGYQYPKPKKKKGKKKKIEYFSLGFEKEKSIAKLKIRSFGKGKAYNRFLRKSFRKIRKSGVKNLVIDLRNNGGGYSNRAIKLLKYTSPKPFQYYNQTIVQASAFYKERMLSNGKFFKKMLIWTHLSSKEMRTAWKLPEGGVDTIYYKAFKPFKKRRFKGNIFVLIDGLSASASALFASSIRQYDMGTLIGEEAGGTTNGTFGNAQLYLLPSSKIKIKMPCIRFISSSSFDFEDTGVLPDYDVPYSIDDFVKEIDTQMGKVYELIDEK